MPRKATTFETIKINTISEMKKVGTYKPEYNQVIDVYCSLIEKYLKINEQIKDIDYNTRTSICLSEENFRRDILKYAAELGLTPAGLKKINDKAIGDKKISPLAEALSKLGQ